MRVEVALPQVDRETVTFRWDQSEPNTFQHHNSFFFRYDGVDLTQFSTPFFYDIFLALQLRVFAAYKLPVEVVFPVPISPSTISFWTSYHQADRVTISPNAETSPYSPWRDERPASLEPAPIGVLFGGGKDSTALTNLIAEAKGPEQVVLFQMTHPLLRKKEELHRIATRQATMMLQPIQQRLGVTIQRATTNYMAQFRFSGSAIRDIRPHLELYSVGLLPAFLAHGIRFCSAAIERTAYRIQYLTDGSRSYYYRESRPETLAAQSRYYQRVLGLPLEIANLNYMFSSLMSMRLLAERYPDSLESIVMCSGAPLGQRWCYHCLKCVEYVFYTLRCGVVDARFDYDFFFTQSRYVLSLMAYAERGVELQPNGNALWEPFISVEGHFTGFCHAIAHLQIGMIKNRLRPDALSNLLMIKALFGHAYFPSVEMLTTGSVNKLGAVGDGIAREIAAIAAEHFTVVDDLPDPVMVGNEEAFFEYDHSMPLWGELTAFDIGA